MYSFHLLRDQVVQWYALYNLSPIIFSAILLNVLSSFVYVSIVRCFNSIMGFFLMCSFFIICNYVAVRRFCAARWTIICFPFVIFLMTRLAFLKLFLRF